MYHENKAMSSADKECEFGVFGETLRTLQKEESEQHEAHSVKIQEADITKKSPEAKIVQKAPEASITQNTMELIKEINSTLKEIAETQKMILEEIKKNNTK